MMYLLNQNFYQILSRVKVENNLTINLQINFNHNIFKGHFPSQPVVPGVCMIQIIKENLEEYLVTLLLIKQTGQLKFLNSIIPAEVDFYTVSIDFQEESGFIKTTSSIKSDSHVYFKGNITFAK